MTVLPARKLILYIDDNEVDQYLVATLIRRMKFDGKVAGFTSAATALLYLQENRNNAAALPDLILLDINMPGMNGFDFLEAFTAIADQQMKIPAIVMLTTSFATEDINRAKSYGLVKDYLVKPILKEALKRLIDRL